MLSRFHIIPACHGRTDRQTDGQTEIAISISRVSVQTNKSLYLANDRHSYYERRIGTRMRFIKWCHFQ